MRISKTVNGVVHEYIYDGDLLISEQFGDTLLIYVYDEAGSPIGFKYRTTSYAAGTFDSYIFAKNILGDIVAIYNTSGTAVATYTYDAWGKIISTGGTLASTIGAYNPFRYRGYYYDTDTGFYYLQSRYYDPEICRFINADNISYLGANGDLNSYNLYAYCNNNPVNRFDDDGNLSLSNWIKIAVGSVAFAGAIAFTVATGGGAAAVAVGVAKIVGSVALGTAVSAGIGYIGNGKQGAIDGACNGFFFGSLFACGGAALKYLSSPTNGIDTYSNLRKVNKGTGNEVHHIIEKRFADSLGIDKTNNMLSIALSKSEHRVLTNAWRAALPYGNSYSKMQILRTAVKIYSRSPKLLAAALKTIL